MKSLAEFSSQCRQSSARALDAFSSLIAQLKDPVTARSARTLLEEIWHHGLTAHSSTDHYTAVEHRCGTLHGKPLALKLILFPSVFTPEQWSMTFFEGLLRYPDAEFYDRRVIEMGTGCGWVSLALAQRFLAREVVGLDINPRAIVCATVNLFLNGMAPDGTRVLDAEGRSLIDRVSFRESDLLQCIGSDERGFDRIIGCIPQVLAPEVGVVSALSRGSASDEELYSLSNYYEQQGVLEDQFGLGLIARALEEAIPILRPNGRLILNLGGRPGARVLEDMIRRRGFAARRVWQVRVQQTADTDIGSLVDIERSIGHQFEFFLSDRSPYSVSAATAAAVQKAGRPIFHSVSVYEAVMNQPTSLKRIVAALQHGALRPILRTIDLREEDEGVTEERFAFLADVLEKVVHNPLGRYGETPGNSDLREGIARYLRVYYRMPVLGADVMVAPSRRSFIQNLLQVFDPDRIVATTPFRALVAPFLDHRDVGARLFEVPEDVSIIRAVGETVRPSALLTSLSASEQLNPEMFHTLAALGASFGALTVVDITEQFGLFSDPPYSGVLDAIAAKGLPPHVVLLCGLEKNRLDADLSLGFAVSSSPDLVHLLTAAAEVTYSRVSTLTQLLYQQVLSDLLAFHVEQDAPVERAVPSRRLVQQRLTAAPHVVSCFAHPAVTEGGLAITDQSIRLDYGENCLPPPDAFIESIAESLCGPRGLKGEALVEAELSLLLQRRFQLVTTSRGRFVFGGGIASLFGAILRWAKRVGRHVIFPGGAYGYFRAALDFFDVEKKILPTGSSLLSVDDLSGGIEGGILYINAPIVNPSGECYPADRLGAIVERAREADCAVIIDAAFSGLGFEPTERELDLGALATRDQSGAPLFLLGGISKEFALAGVRFGYLYGTHGAMTGEVARMCCEPALQSMVLATGLFLKRLNSGEKGIEEHLSRQRELLSRRALALTQVLSQNGWEVLPPAGGLFLIARPPVVVGKDCVQEANAVVRRLFETTGVAINNARWTGLPGYCRFVLSVEEETFEQALNALAGFRL